MSYRIEINADTLSELAGKLLALAAQMQAVPATATVPATGEATEGKAPARKTRAAKQDTEASSAPAGTPDVGTSTSDSGQTATEAASPSEPEPQPEAPKIDFQTDIAPLVIALVEKGGPPAIEAVLSEFGVAKASQVPVDQHAELRDALSAALHNL